MMWTPAPKSTEVLFSIVQPVKEAQARLLTATPAAPGLGLTLLEKVQLLTLPVTRGLHSSTLLA